MRILFVSMLTLLLFSQCKKTYVNNTVNQVFSAKYQIKSTDWGTTDGGLTYQTDLPIAELDNVIQTGGGVLVYLSLDGNGSETTYEAVPEVVSGVAYGTFHSVGHVFVDLQSADPTAPVTPPNGTIDVKVILLDAVPLD